MTTTAHTQVVQKQFGEQAAAYLSSAVHAQGTEFALLQAELAGQGGARLLDLGCGAGHVSFHVAPLVKDVVAYDLSQQMLGRDATGAQGPQAFGNDAECGDGAQDDRQHHPAAGFDQFPHSECPLEKVRHFTI